MSGGSYNYLHYSMEYGLEGELARMRDRLAEVAPQSKAARDMAAIGETMKRLAPVAYAVEWCDSGDASEESMHAAIAAYEGDQR